VPTALELGRKGWNKYLEAARNRSAPPPRSASREAERLRLFPVVRYDSSHGFAHRDLFDMRGQKRKTPLFTTDRNDALTFAESDIKDNWEIYRQRFLQEAKR